MKKECVTSRKKIKAEYDGGEYSQKVKTIPKKGFQTEPLSTIRLKFFFYVDKIFLIFSNMPNGGNDRQ